MALLEDLLSMASGGTDPRSQLLQALAPQQPPVSSPQAPVQQPDASAPPDVVPVAGSPGATVPLPPVRPAGLTDADGNVLPQSAGNMQANAQPQTPATPATPAPPTPVPGGGNPPDITALYQKILDRQQSQDMFWNGAKLAAASYSTPSMAAAIMNSPNNPGGANPGDALKTMLALQGMQQANQQKARILAAMPGVAQKLGVDPDVLTQIYLNDPAKYAELASKLVTPNRQFSTNALGQRILEDPQKGTISLPNATGNVPLDDKGNPVDINPVKPDNDPNSVRVLNDMQTNWQKYGLPDPNDPANKAQWSALSQRVLAPGGQTINVGGSQTAMDKARAEMQAGDMGEYNTATSGLSNIAAFRDAIKQGGDDITTGPQGPAALKAKEALGGLFGIQLPGTSAAETMQLLGTQLATTASKEISSRPAAMEWQKILTVKPGIENSPEGTMAKLNLMEQQLQSKRDLAVLASHYTGNDWVGEKDKYYASHPFKSPFDPSQDLSQADVVRVAGAPTPLPETIAMLKANPSQAAKFDEFYGRGAAAKILGSN